MENHPRQFVSEIVSGIITNIEDHYQFIDYMNQPTNKKSVATSIKNYQEVKYKGNDKSLTAKLISVIKLQNQYIANPQTFYHVEVHKQFLPNLCGYHATFNLIQAIRAYKYDILPQFDNIASFWIYVKRTQEFLTEHRKKYRLGNSEWPWTDKDINGGDFERTYLKVCLAYKPLFKQTFQSETVDGVQYNVTFDTIFFQYSNVVNDYSERKSLQKKFDQFHQFRGKANEKLIQAYMLGVTNHWVALIGISDIEGKKFLVMDSRNRDCFEWNEAHMIKFLNEENERRILKGQQAWNKFYLDLNLQGMKDIQQLISLMISWMSGQTTLEGYVSNQKLRVFLLPLVELMELTENQFLQQKGFGDKIPEIHQVVCLWADQYRHTIYDFLGSSYQDITFTNLKLFTQTLEILKMVQNYEQQINRNQKNTQVQQILKAFNIIQSNLK